MAAVWMRARAEIRSGWRSLVAVMLLVGIGGALALASAAGARRTESAYPRFLRESKARDFLVSPAGTSLTGFADAVARLPDVVDHGVVAGFNVGVLSPAGSGREELPVGGFVAVDRRVFREIERPNVIAGRLPDPSVATEVGVNQAMADAMDLAPGNTFRIRIHSGPSEATEPITVTVAGVIVNASEVVPVARFDTFPGMMMTAAAFERWKDVALAFDGVLLRVRPGTDAAGFERTVRALARRFEETGGEVFFADDRGRRELVSRALRPQVFALAAFAIIAGATVLLVAIQIVGRQTLIEASENPTLRAIGMTTSELVFIAMLRAAIIAIGGAVIAVVAAIAASPFAPIGPAKLAETSPGIAVDGVVLAVGAAAMIVLIVASVVPRAARAARSGSATASTVADMSQAQPSRVAGAASRLARSPSVATGLRLAFEPGRGRSAVPVRTTIAGTLIALVAVTATFTVGSSLDRLVSTPRLYGQDWDLVFDIGFGVVPKPMSEQMMNDPALDAMAGGAYGLLVVEGRQVPAVGIDQLRGEIYPTIIEGRPAVAPGEIVLGSTTLDRVGRRVGDEVTVRTAARDSRMRIVGRAVFPQLGQGSFTPTGLGTGAAVPVSSLGAADIPPGEYSFVAMRLRPGADRAAVKRRIEGRCVALLQQGDDLCEIVTSQTPPDIANYARIRTTPIVLAALLVVLAAATLAHALVTSVRRRRRDLAILRTIGFSRAQLVATVSWQAGGLTLAALVFGVPLGIAAGHWMWSAFAAQLGVPSVTTTPLAIVASITGGALALALIVAALPARAAARTRPASVLRTE